MMNNNVGVEFAMDPIYRVAFWPPKAIATPLETILNLSLLVVILEPSPFQQSSS
jgi:hypothetical protein